MAMRTVVTSLKPMTRISGRRRGFDDSNYFPKMFTRQFGPSPRAYRKADRDG